MANIGSSAAGVSLVENEVKHVQHRAQTLRSLLRCGRLEGDARFLDGLLGAAGPFLRTSELFSDSCIGIKNSDIISAAARWRK